VIFLQDVLQRRTTTQLKMQKSEARRILQQMLVDDLDMEMSELPSTPKERNSSLNFNSLHGERSILTQSSPYVKASSSKKDDVHADQEPQIFRLV
jgi:hypothetical protein